MNYQHLSVDDMRLITKLRMTAFGESVVEIATAPASADFKASSWASRAE